MPFMDSSSNAARAAARPAPCADGHALARAPHGTAWAELALAMGGLAIGTAEFAAMGILPEVAGNLHVSVPRAGHLISAYALGVVVGAPAITVLCARAPRRVLLVGLMLLYALGNFASARLHDFDLVMLSRFVAGLPHGAYFGVASIVAAAMVPPSRRALAIGKVMLGLSVANVVGVPAATWLGQAFGWRATFEAVAGIALLTAALVQLLAPAVPAARGAGPLTELGAFRRGQVWLTLLAAAIGFGGIFAVYSYITPLLTQVTGMPAGHVPIVLSVIGVGMIVGNLVCGKLADLSLRNTMVGMYAFTALLLALLPWAAHHVWLAAPVLFLIGAGAMVTPAFQSRLMDVAGDAQSLAAALNHSAFNIANATGAWLGGLVIAAGFGWTSTAWVGMVLALGGVVVLTLSFALERRVPTSLAAAPSARCPP
jgi:MFS transporter, DHA1 family, inner membrane transport protein